MVYKITYQQNGKVRHIKLTANSYEQLINSSNYPKNILNIKIVESFDIVKFLQKDIDIKIFNKRQKDIYTIFLSLDMMLRSSLSFSQAIELLLKTTQSGISKEILNSINHSLTSSKPISEVLRRYLDDTILLFLELGIKNGNIKEAINSIVIILKEDQTTKNKIYDSIRYPLILFGSLVVSLIMIFTYVVPNFEFIFISLGDNLPVSTKILLGVKHICQKYYEFIILTTVVFICLIAYLSKIYKYYIDKFLLFNIPIVSKVIRSYYMFKLFLSLSIIVNSKYQFQVAIENSKNVVSNRYIKKIINNIVIDIKDGFTIAEAFSRSSFFDPFTIKLLYVAQETSMYGNILSELTKYHKEVFKDFIKNFSAMLEPIMVFFISFIVMWLVLAIMTPIWDMNSVL
jgi:general secretion pathway protein F